MAKEEKDIQNKDIEETEKIVVSTEAEEEALASDVEIVEDELETEVEVSEEAISEVEKLQDELAQMEDKYLRASAEMANMNNRNRSERELLVRYRSQDLGKKLLPSVDNLERALAADVSDEQSAGLKKGVEMVLESLIHALKEEGIEPIEAKGAAFDPNLHQAVQTVPATDEAPADTIVEVLQTGYKLHDRVLRPSMVIVAQ